MSQCAPADEGEPGSANLLRRQGSTLPSLPTGIVTFLFTDIEESTKIARTLGPGYSEVLDRHNDILRSAIRAFDGVQVSTEGDSFFAVFTTPGDAVRAAIEAQREILEESWPTAGSVQVRVGIHTGEGRLGGDNYAGLDVIKAARISDAGHGGQILVSETTRALLGANAEYRWRELGRHRLKGLDDAEPLYQVLHEDLAADFPALRTGGGLADLPRMGSVFVGREREVSEIADLLEHHRIVTLTGPGGIGKTRLAVHLTSEMAARFRGRVFIVKLDTLDDPQMVVPTIASTIGAAQMGDQVEAIVERVGLSPALIVLDNFEKVVTAGSDLVRIVEACPELRLLVTSQRLLRIRAEQAYPVPLLGLPSNDTVKAVHASDSGSLFTHRARRSDPGFVLSGENAGDVAAIVRFLDGLPLAIELAAARVRLFGVAGLRQKLEDGGLLLSGGFADAPDRHQSLELAIDWSFGLLDEASKALLRRLSVFAGGFTLDAAEDICSGAPISSLSDTLIDLLDCSLVGSTTTGAKPRFTMLASVRSYATSKLLDSGEGPKISRAHCAHFTGLATRAAEYLHGPEHYSTVDRLMEERENLFAALDWAANNEPDLGLSIMSDLAFSFPVIGALVEGRRLAVRLLEGGGSPRPRLTGLLGAGAVTYWLNDYEAADLYYRDAVELATELEDRDGLAEALFGLAFTQIWLGRIDEALATAEQVKAVEGPDNTRRNRGISTLAAFAMWMRDDLSGAAAKFAQTIEMSRAVNDEGEELFNMLALSGILGCEGKTTEAAAVGLFALNRFAKNGDEGGMIHALDWLSGAATALSPKRGLIVSGAAEALRERRGGFIALNRLGVPNPRSLADQTLTEPEIEDNWQRGRALSLGEATALARELLSSAGVTPRAADLDAARSQART